MMILVLCLPVLMQIFLSGTWKMRITPPHGSTRWRVWPFLALQPSNQKVKTNILFTQQAPTKQLESFVKVHLVKAKRLFDMSKVSYFHKLLLCTTEKLSSVVLVSRINLALFKFSNIPMKRLTKYRFTLCQWNVLELATIINHFLVVPTMAPLRFSVFRKETPGKKIKTCQPSNTQSSS